MSRYLIIASKISAVFAIFFLLLLGNILLQKHDIQVDISSHGCNDPYHDLACLGVSPKGEVSDSIDISAPYMYLSSAIFVFLSLLLFNPKQYKYLTPILTIIWIILGEIFVRIFSIGVVSSSLLGVIMVFDSLYLGFFHNEIIYIIPLILIVSIIAGKIAYYVSLWTRKNFIKSHNSA